MQQRDDTSITVNGIKYDFQGRFDTKKVAEERANVWKKRDYKTMVRKALHPYTGYFFYIES